MRQNNFQIKVNLMNLFKELEAKSKISGIYCESSEGK